MKRSTVLGLVALTLAGAAAAQTLPPNGNYVYPAQPSPQIYQSRPEATPDYGPPERSWSGREVLDRVNTALPQMRHACAAERRAFCADQKTALGADRCVARHRSELTVPCRTAIAQARATWDPQP